VVDKQQQIEMIGKVFVVTCGIRRCLIWRPRVHSDKGCESCDEPLLSAQYGFGAG